MVILTTISRKGKLFMDCRAGIATDPEKRRQYWQGLPPHLGGWPSGRANCAHVIGRSMHPHLRGWRVIASGLSYSDAQRK